MKAIAVACFAVAALQLAFVTTHKLAWSSTTDKELDRMIRKDNIKSALIDDGITICSDTTAVTASKNLNPVKKEVSYSK
ncbi:MAG TPA: hypothetical protein VFE50_18870 [Cyclobacteriaceae bacterium]|nr:hypothetical protein [Cyclobacteriaceae bacterium]